jgi:hypothetical protein
MQMTFEKMTFAHGCFEEPVIYEKLIQHLKNDCGQKFGCPMEPEGEQKFNKK